MYLLKEVVFILALAGVHVYAQHIYSYHKSAVHVSFMWQLFDDFWQCIHCFSEALNGAMLAICILDAFNVIIMVRYADSAFCSNTSPLNYLFVARHWKCTVVSWCGDKRRSSTCPWKTGWRGACSSAWSQQSTTGRWWTQVRVSDLNSSVDTVWKLLLQFVSNLESQLVDLIDILSDILLSWQEAVCQYDKD